MMPTNFADDIADAMTLIHKGWQVLGCKRLLLAYASEAPTVPIGEIGRAALAFAEAPGIVAPSLELFRNGPWWTAQMPAHARTVRPSDAPKCSRCGMEPAGVDGIGRNCRSDDIAMTDDALAAREAQTREDMTRRAEASRRARQEAGA